MKIYKCCICKKTLQEKPIRLVKEIYGAGRYNQHYPVTFYDFCERCYSVFQRWIDKYNDVNVKKR